MFLFFGKHSEATANDVIEIYDTHKIGDQGGIYHVRNRVNPYDV